MGQLYQGITGKSYSVNDKKIAGGGEGNIYAIENSPSQVAKVFKPDKRTSQREEKLSLMVKIQLSDKELNQIAWPQDVIYDKNGFVGYVMPKVKDSSPLNGIYNADKYDLRYRLMVAINMCIAVDTIHEIGQVCGDLNPQNICINTNINDKMNALHVTLVDTDSYHFKAQDRTYRCEVGLGDYIAPELQKKMSSGIDLRTVSLPSYTRETDLFALAVHIFQLLMNGCHPFACAYNNNLQNSNIGQLKSGTNRESVVAPQPIENIVKGFFPFVDNKTGITIPVYAPKFETLPVRIRNCFIRTFKEGYLDPSKRVSAAEWKDVLTASLSELKQCSSNPKHFYFNNSIRCPLCEIENNFVKTMQAYSQSSSTAINTGKTPNSNVAILNSRTQKSNNKQAAANTTKQSTQTIKTTVNISKPSTQINTTPPKKNTEFTWFEFLGLILIILLIVAKCRAELDESYGITHNENTIDYETDDINTINYETDDNNKEELEKLSVIINSIYKNDYQSAADKLTEFIEYADSKGDVWPEYYIKDGELVDTIYYGKGFRIEGYRVFLGDFSDGELDGSGLEIGIWPDSKDYYWIKGTFKDGYANGECEYYKTLDNRESDQIIKGNFTDGYEDGDMEISRRKSVKDKYRKYYYNAYMGTYKEIDADGQGNKTYDLKEGQVGYALSDDGNLLSLNKDYITNKGTPYKKEY